MRDLLIADKSVTLFIDTIQGILIDEKFLGSSQGFVTTCFNAATGEPLEMVKGKDSHCLNDFFDRFNAEEKRKSNTPALTDSMLTEPQRSDTYLALRFAMMLIS